VSSPGSTCLLKSLVRGLKTKLK